MKRFWYEKIKKKRLKNVERYANDDIDAFTGSATLHDILLM